MMDLSEFLIRTAPPSVYYVPNFITDAQEQRIIEQVNSAPKPKWTQLSNRRLQNWGGVPHPKGMVAEKIPAWLQEYVTKIGQTGCFKEGKIPNHVLVNEYLPGQGIMPHTDGPLFYPVVTTITCGSHTVLELKRKVSDELEVTSSRNQTAEGGCEESKFSLLLERRSLVILEDVVYKNYLHSIEEMTNDIVGSVSNLQLCSKMYEKGEKLTRGIRISLTIRHVPCTSRVLLRLSK